MAVGFEGGNILNAVGGAFLVLACMLASNLYVRRKSPGQPKPREVPKGNARMKDGKEGSMGGIANAKGQRFSVLGFALRRILRSCGASFWTACHCWKYWTDRHNSDLARCGFRA